MNKDWPGTSLKELATITMGQSPESSCVNTSERGLPFLQGCAEFGARIPSAKFYCSLPLRVAKSGSVLISVRAPVGTTNSADQDYCIGRGLGAVLAKQDVADNRFLLYAIEQNVSFLHRRSQGSTFLAVGSKELSQLPIPALRLETQRRIAEILSTLDETIEQTEALIAKYQQIKAGLMHDLFTRGVTPNGRLRPTRAQAPHLYKESSIGWIPKEWKVRPLVTAVSQKPNAIVDGPFGSNLKTIHYRTSGVPVIQSGYVTSGLFRADNYYYVTEAHFLTQSRSKVDPGDIVMAKIGAQAGMCAVLPEDHPFGILAGNSLKISADNSVLQRDWLVAYLHWLYATTGMSGLRTETAQPAISLTRLKKQLVPVPAGPEQTIGTKFINALNQNLAQQAGALEKNISLKHGLMHDLLTGRVRVKIDEHKESSA